MDWVFHPRPLKSSNLKKSADLGLKKVKVRSFIVAYIFTQMREVDSCKDTMYCIKQIVTLH